MRSELDNNNARGLVLKSALSLGIEHLAISANQVLAGGMPPAISYDPAATTRTVTMYAPLVTANVIEHEIFNVSAGAGNLTILDPTGVTTLGTISPGGHAQVIWIPKLAAWLCFPELSGQAAQTAAAKVVIQQYTTLAALVSTNVIGVAVPFNFILNSVGFRVRTPATTAAKLATLTSQINGVSVTGGVVSLTSANATPTNTLVAGTTVTALNVGTAGQVLSALISAVTTFVEGDGYLEWTLTNTQLAA